MIYKQLHHYVSPDEIIINCKEQEDTELRFWQPNDAYQWYLNEQQINFLLEKGYKIAAFKSHGAQQLPEFITKNPKIRILDLQLK
jgi:hypothetical protein